MNKNVQRRLLTIGLISYVILMIVGAIIPNPEDIPGFGGNTSYFHFFGFMLLSFIVFRLFELYNFKYKNIYSVLALLFFIVFTEFLQLFVKTRSSSTGDMLVDLIGSVLGYLSYRLIYSN